MSSERNLIERILQEASPGLVKATGDGALPWVRIELAPLERTLSILGERGGMKTITALIGRDTGQEIELTYVLRRSGGEVGGVRILLPRQAPKAPSLAGRWPALRHHEREIAELLGVEFEGASVGHALLPEDWVGLPLRKDYVFPESYRGVEHRRAPLRKEHQRP